MKDLPARQPRIGEHTSCYGVGMSKSAYLHFVTVLCMCKRAFKKIHASVKPQSLMIWKPFILSLYYKT